MVTNRQVANAVLDILTKSRAAYLPRPTIHQKLEPYFNQPVPYGVMDQVGALLREEKSIECDRGRWRLTHTYRQRATKPHSEPAPIPTPVRAEPPAPEPTPPPQSEVRTYSKSFPSVLDTLLNQLGVEQVPGFHPDSDAARLIRVMTAMTHVATVMTRP